MKNENYNLFIITKGIEQRVIHAFLSINYDTAKLYFENFIKNMLQKQELKLYKIGKINKDLTITEQKYYITSGYANKNEIAYQKKFEILKDKKLIEQCSQNIINKTTSQIIKELFNGKDI